MGVDDCFIHRLPYLHGDDYTGSFSLKVVESLYSLCIVPFKYIYSRGDEYTYHTY